jgi:hypothetical protein
MGTRSIEKAVWLHNQLMAFAKVSCNQWITLRDKKFIFRRIMDSNQRILKLWRNKRKVNPALERKKPTGHVRIQLS